MCHCSEWPVVLVIQLQRKKNGSSLTARVRARIGFDKRILNEDLIDYTPKGVREPDGGSGRSPFSGHS